MQESSGVEKDCSQLYPFVSSTCRLYRADADTMQVVLGEYGNRHRVDPPPQPSLQRDMALLGVCGCLLPKCGALRLLPLHLHTAVHVIPSYLECHDSPACSVTFPWHVSHGFRNYRKHGCLRLRSSLGRLGIPIGRLTLGIRSAYEHSDLKHGRLGLSGGLMQQFL
jgi:hypothetical protein